MRKRGATNYFRLMTPSVDQWDSNELVTERPAASLCCITTVAMYHCSGGWRVASAACVCLFGYGKQLGKHY